MHIVMQGVVLEIVAWFLQWIMDNCKTRVRDLDFPSLCTLVNHAYSPIVVVLQYLSGLLSGKSARLQLVYRRARCDSWDTFCASPSLMQFRRLVLTASCWFYSKVAVVFLAANSWPWRLATLVDPRQSVSNKLATAVAFAKAELCCLDEYCSRRLRAFFPKVMDPRILLIDRFYITSLLSWAWSVVLGSLPVENRHAINRKYSGLAWVNFVTPAVNSLTETLQRDRHLTVSRYNESLAAASLAAGGDDDDDDPAPTVYISIENILQRRKRKATVFEVRLLVDSWFA